MTWWLKTRDDYANVKNRCILVSLAYKIISFQNYCKHSVAWQHWYLSNSCNTSEHTCVCISFLDPKIVLFSHGMGPLDGSKPNKVHKSTGPSAQNWTATFAKNIPWDSQRKWRSLHEFHLHATYQWFCLCLLIIILNTQFFPFEMRKSFSHHTGEAAQRIPFHLYY